jgi:acetylornithine/N-succinyldiaminopimelate aminotransferase
VSKVIKPGSHGSTFGGNQLACAVSLAVIKEVAKKKLLDDVMKLGNYLHKEINKLIKKNPKILIKVFGKGLMIGIKCHVPNIKLTGYLRDKGLLVVPASNNVIRLLPPLNISKKEAEKAIYLISEAIREFK